MSNERVECAGRLEKLAADPRFDARADDLRSLAAAVRDQGDGTWTGIDLVGAFPAEASINVGKQHWIERAVGITAGASVFLPVAWTWWSIYRASDAYRELLDDEGETGRTFLSMWTTGFDGRLDGWHEFGPTALVAFGLVAIAVLFVVLNRWVSDHYMFKEETSGGAARRELVAALGRAQRFLNERRTDDPRFLEAALKRSVAELNQAHEQTREGVEALREATTAAVTRFEGAARGVLDELKPLLVSADQASQTFAQSAGSAAVLQEKVLTSTQEFDQTLRGALTSFEETVASSTGNLADSSRTAADTLTSGVTGAVSGLAETLDKMAAAQKTTESVLSGGVEAQAQASRASLDAAAELTRVLEAHQTALQGQSSDLTRAADLASQLLHELRARGH